MGRGGVSEILYEFCFLMNSFKSTSQKSSVRVANWLPSRNAAKEVREMQSIKGTRVWESHLGSMRRSVGSLQQGSPAPANSQHRNGLQSQAWRQLKTAPGPHSPRTFFDPANPKPVYHASPIPSCRNDNAGSRPCFPPAPLLLTAPGFPTWSLLRGLLCVHPVPGVVLD